MPSNWLDTDDYACNQYPYDQQTFRSSDSHAVRFRLHSPCNDAVLVSDQWNTGRSGVVGSDYRQPLVNQPGTENTFSLSSQRDG